MVETDFQQADRYWFGDQLVGCSLTCKFEEKIVDEIRFIDAHEICNRMRLERPLIFLDVETTGPYPQIDRVIQLGFIRIEPSIVSEGGAITEAKIIEKELLFSIEGSVPSESTAIHHITNDMVFGKPEFYQQAKQLAEVLNGDICGYNGDFDIQMLQAEFDRCQVTWSHGLLVDPFKIFLQEEKRDLTAATKFYLGEDHTNAHTALADTRVTLRVLLAQLKKYQHIPNTVKDLNHHLFGKIPEGYLDPKRRLAKRDGEIIIAFGTHTGKRLKDQVPSSYLEWILRTDFDPLVKEIIRQETGL